jgi:hypothetical protein
MRRRKWQEQNWSKKISLNNEKLCEKLRDILCIGSKTLHISYDEKEKKETKAFFI